MRGRLVVGVAPICHDPSPTSVDVGNRGVAVLAEYQPRQ
jgi:hypothetical protein